MLIQKVTDATSQLLYIPRTLRIIWVASHRWTVSWAVILTVLGLIPAATVYLTRALVDSLVVAVQGGGSLETLLATFYLGSMMIGAMLLGQVLQSVMAWVRATQAEYVFDYLTSLIHQKATAVDLAHYEIPEYYDQLERVRDDLSGRPLALLESIGNLSQSAITLIAMAALLIPYGWWLPVVLFFGTLPAFYVVIHFNRRFHGWWLNSTSDRRHAEYYDMMLTVAESAAEIRIFSLESFFQTAYLGVRQRLRGQYLGLVKAQGFAQLGAGILAGLILGLTMAWMVWRAIVGQFTLGDLALFYQAYQRGQGLFHALLSNLGQIYNNLLFLENLFEFLDLKPQITNPSDPVPTPAMLTQEINFKNVTFRYPGSKRAVLKTFNFTIPAGKIVAIVGANGAGKTTFFKLLCRLYDPEEGCIEFDGVDIRNFSLSELRRMVTVMFQFPVPYFMAAAENIAMGDRAANPEVAKIQSAARSAGAHNFIDRLPQGYNTLLGKWFEGGNELSGGEWERLALARAFLRQAPIMILDEPTSFMDSWSEIDWFDRFHQLARGRTAILITHRFTIARHADIIHVMDAGEIVESGTHEELLALGGRYAQSWIAQVQENSKLQNRNGSQPVTLERTNLILETLEKDRANGHNLGG